MCYWQWHSNCFNVIIIWSKMIFFFRLIWLCPLFLHYGNGNSGQYICFSYGFSLRKIMWAFRLFISVITFVHLIASSSSKIVRLDLKEQAVRDEWKSLCNEYTPSTKLQIHKIKTFFPHLLPSPNQNETQMFMMLMSNFRHAMR